MVLSQRLKLCFLGLPCSSPLGRGTGGGAGRGTGRVYVIDDYYVVEIKLQKSDYHQIYTVQERDAKGFKYNRLAVHSIACALYECLALSDSG